MASLIVDMGLVLSVWLVFWCQITGVGLLLRRLLRFEPPDGIGLLLTFWLGWGGTVAALQLWHLRFPIGSGSRVFVLALGFAGAVVGRRDLAAVWRRRGPYRRRRSMLLLSLTAAMTLLVANHALSAPELFDTGLYHLQAVRWAEAYPIVPGLANLHQRLGGNSSYFLYVALIDLGLWHGESYRLANGLLLLAALLPVLWWAGRVGGGRWSALVCLFLLPPLTNQSVRLYVPSPTPDLAVLCLGIAQFLFLLRFSEPATDVGRAREGLFAVAWLAAAATSVKLSGLGLSWASLAVALLVARRRPLLAGTWLRTGALVFGGVVAILLPWAARGVVLTGYAAYPSTFGPAAVEWRLPSECVRRTAEHIESFARIPSPDQGHFVRGWSWLGPWAQRVGVKYQEVVIPSALALGAFVILAGRRRTDGLLLAVPGLIALLFWFLSAPDPRFALAPFWIVASVLAAVAVGSGTRGWPWKAAVGGGVLLALLPLRHASLTRAREPMPVATVENHKTDSGLIVRVPRGDPRCWDAAIPCAPKFQPELRLRRPHDLASGFVVAWSGPALECAGEVKAAQTVRPVSPEKASTP